jgi:3-oxo-5-alpha-steroid 4-dehydrogenase 3
MTVFLTQGVEDGLSLALNLLSPAYVLLSVSVLVSRHVKLLSRLASHGKTRTTTFTPTRTNKLGFWISKRYFGHFYIVGLASWASLRLLVYRILNNEYAQSFCLADALLLVHLIRRCYESYHIQKPSASSKMHFLGYLLGVGHYLVLPLVSLRFEAVDPPTRTTSQKTLAISSLLLGVANLVFQNEQFQHHRILASLRQDGKASSTKTYSVPPRKRWFYYILSPHYLAEILIYLTWALLLDLDRQQQGIDQDDNLFISTAARKRHWFLFVWVTTNLTVSSLNSFDWYSSQYTTTSLGHRTALIPYLL